MNRLLNCLLYIRTIHLTNKHSATVLNYLKDYQIYVFGLCDNILTVYCSVFEMVIIFNLISLKLYLFVWFDLSGIVYYLRWA